MSQVELKPCPRFGNKQISGRVKSKDKQGTQIVVACLRCGIKTKPGYWQPPPRPMSHQEAGEYVEVIMQDMWNKEDWSHVKIQA